MTTKVWNVTYYLGTTDRIARVSSSPMTKALAIATGSHIANINGWRVWVEHVDTKERAWESKAEKEARTS